MSDQPIATGPAAAAGSGSIAVIGAGVAGLTTAVCLAEAGCPVTVHAELPPERTTSAVAGALWGPHLAGRDQRVPGWAATTLGRLRELAGDPATGVRIASGLAATAAYRAEPPGYTDGAGPMKRCDRDELPAGFASGWRYRAPVIAMPVYLAYLAGRLRRAGGILQPGRRFADLAAVRREITATVIVNCTGIGARQLVPDPGVIPVRGQVMVVANPGVTGFFVGEAERPADVTYYFAHDSTVVLGGTQQHGNPSTEPDPADADRIRRACAAVEPRLADAPVLAHLAGLRPVRDTVRLGGSPAPDGRLLVHNYGHGGSGVTLSWGCAQEVAALILNRAGGRQPRSS